jgi:ribosome-binding factor A
MVWQRPVAARALVHYVRDMAKNTHSSGRGPNQRQLRVGELIRRTLSDVLMRGDVHDPELNRISVTVGEVTTTSDYRVATVYVLPLGGKGGEELLTILRRHTGELRHLVSKQLTLKFAPELRFRLDETFDRMDETRRLFSDETVMRDVAARDDDDTAEA